MNTKTFSDNLLVHLTTDFAHVTYVLLNMDNPEYEQDFGYNFYGG